MADEAEQDQQKNPELIRLLQSGTKSESEIRPTSSENANSSSSEWTAEETTCLLKLIAEYEYLPQIKSKNDQVYTKLSKLMTISGHKKTNYEIKYYWKELKQNYEDHKAGKLKQFEFYEQLNNLLLELISSTHSEPEIIIIKGEELEGNILNSDSFDNNFSCDEFEPKNGRGVRRNNWTYKETECVVQVLEKYGMPSRTNLRKFCFVIVDYLKQHGFSRSEEQAQVKIKHLRALYNQVVRKTLKEEEFPFFKRIEALMHTHLIHKVKDNDETQNYIMLDEQSKSDGEDNVATDFNEPTTADEEDTCYKKGRQIWTNKEIRVLLKFIEENGIITGKQLRKICNKAVDFLASHNYYRSPTQILIRWKNTKALYWATFRKKSKIPERECSFFYRLHAILNPDDCSYETKHFDDTGDEDEQTSFFQNNDNTNNLETNTDLPNFHFNEVSHNQPTFHFKRDFISLQNNSNSNDNFISLQNVTSTKRFHIAEMPIDPLENGSSDKVTPSSPKRSRIDHKDLPLNSSGCSFCNSLDPIDHYCISLAHSIKKLDARKQAKLKIEIQQLMYKAEFDPDF